jgi:hypothetical protein
MDREKSRKGVRINNVGVSPQMANDAEDTDWQGLGL